MALTTGLFNTSLNPAELNTRSFAGAILRQTPNGTAPLFALTSQSKTGRAKSSTHGYFTKLFTFARINVSVAATNVATTLTLTSSAGVVPGMVFETPPPARELIRVLTVPTATSITVARAAGRKVAVPILINTAMSIVGNSHEEGSLRPISRGITPSYVPNFTSIVRNAWAVNDTARASMTEMGYGNLGESRRDGLLFHAADKEATMFFSQPSAPAVGANGNIFHQTQGIIDAVDQYAPANMVLLGLTTNYTQLETATEGAFKFSSDIGNSNERLLFVDAIANKVINQIGRLNGLVEIVQGETEFGLRYKTFQTYKGTFRIIEHPMFNDHASMAGTAVAVDLPAVRLAYMDGRNVKAELYGVGGKAADGGIDAIGGSFTSEFAVECLNPSAFQVITGFTAGAAG